MRSARSLVQAEVFDTELDQARALCSSGYHTAAAVIARTVLETAMREICTAHGIGPGKLDLMNADLAKSGAYNKLVQKQVTWLSGVGNAAAHGKVADYSEDDVVAMVGQTETFLLTHLPQ
nr:DUF4145 domain-containing protein [Pinirhizobacter soli]